MTLLLDTHALHWWTAEPDRLSPVAVEAIESADELAVAAITWYELGWLAHHGRITVTIPVRSWLTALAANVQTIGVTSDIAETAVALPESFLGDPADRLIFASAIETGSRLVTKDRRMRDHPAARPITIW